jgi:hypothetical protein
MQQRDRKVLMEKREVARVVALAKISKDPILDASHPSRTVDQLEAGWQEIE